MSKIASISGQQERLDSDTLDKESVDRLRSKADQVAAWEVIPRPRSDSSLQRRVMSARQKLCAARNQTCSSIASRGAD